MSDAPLARDHSRLLWMVIPLLGLLSLLIAQYYRLQIIENAYWEEKAQRQHFVKLEEEPQRGIFYGTTARGDRMPLVLNVRHYRLHVDPLAISPDERMPLVDALTVRLSLNDVQRDFIAQQMVKKSRSRNLRIELPMRERKSLEEWWKQYAKARKLPLQALFYVPGWWRRHPYGSLLGQLLHGVHQQLPTGGLEVAFDHVLKGFKGVRQLMRSPRHSFESSEEVILARDGSSIELTIDPFIQSILEEELMQGVQRSGAKCGWAVMMNPHTGAIMAIGQYPYFDPDCCAEYFNDPIKREETRIIALSDAREPGSVMKPITIALGLTANERLAEQGLPPIFSPNEKFATSSGRFPGRSKPLQDTSLHYFLDMNMAIRKSSSIYMGRIVERILATLGKEWYATQLKELFGFGLKTGIELPGESCGFLPQPGTLYASGKQAWSVATPFSLAMGYNIQTTSLQIIRAHAVFANGGYFVQPTLLHRPVEKKRVISEDVVRKVVAAMKYTTKSGGSAQRADLFGYTEAGKSGTAKKVVGGQYSETLYNSSFVGFAPVSKAAFVLLVTMSEPTYGFFPGYGKNHHGGSCAAVTFRSIGRRTLAYLGVPYDDPHGFPSGDPRRKMGTPDWTLETEKLQKVYESWNKPAS